MLLDAVRKHAEGHIAKHKANVLVYLNNPAGIGEHPDVVQAIETQIEAIANAEEKIETIHKHYR